ncbi:MAG: hypothetical protein ABI741_15130 [Ferruginibacter sp.]
MRVAIKILLLVCLYTNSQAQDCDIATTGVAIVNASNTANVLSGCIGQVYNFKFSIANFGSSPSCTIPANSVTAVFDFPTLAGNIKPYIYNGPASFVSGYFTWNYNSIDEQLIGTNTTAIPYGNGDGGILVQVKGNAVATGSSTLNLRQGGATTNNTSNDIASAQLVINALPAVSWTNTLANQCVSSTTYSITGGTPSGGVYSGPGVTGTNFNANIAGTGTHTLTYTYTNASGCSKSATRTIQVNALPTVSFSGLAATYCTTNPAVTLTGSPAGGIFSGPGVSGNTFNPATAGAGGPYNIVYSYTNANGCSNNTTQQVTVTVCSSTVTVNLKLFLQGYYSGSSSMQPVLSNQSVPSSLATQCDTITVELHHPVNFTLIDTKKAVLLTNGTASATFSQPAGSYFIAVRHRNSIQTWTAAAVACTTSTPLYNFSTAANKAFDSNQAQVAAGVWAFFTGDINQDEYIDGNDFPLYDTQSASSGLYDGTYTPTDLNGDGFVDGNDFPVYDVNSSNGVSSIHP